jgi:hypothetical protein
MDMDMDIKINVDATTGAKALNCKDRLHRRYGQWSTSCSAAVRRPTYLLEKIWRKRRAFYETGAAAR